MPRTQSIGSVPGSESQQINERQREGRAANAVADLLMRRLLVPKIFFEAKGFVFSGERVDLLAIDRAGSGDIHVVKFKLSGTSSPSKAVISNSVKALLNAVPAHFKYLAVDRRSLDTVSQQQLFAKDGIGRVGIIEITEKPSSPPEARIVIAAERFRLEHNWIKKFDAFQKKTQPDIEIRY